MRWIGRTGGRQEGREGNPSEEPGPLMWLWTLFGSGLERDSEEEVVLVRWTLAKGQCHPTRLAFKFRGLTRRARRWKRSRELADSSSGRRIRRSWRSGMRITWG